jgi:hypothetical protein
LGGEVKLNVGGLEMLKMGVKWLRMVVLKMGETWVWVVGGGGVKDGGELAIYGRVVKDVREVGGPQGGVVA